MLHFGIAYIYAKTNPKIADELRHRRTSNPSAGNCDMPRTANLPLKPWIYGSLLTLNGTSEAPVAVGQWMTFNYRRHDLSCERARRGGF